MTEAMNEQNEYRAALDCVCRWKQAALDAKTFYELDGQYVPIRTTEAIVAYDTIRKSLEFMAANHEAVRDRVEKAGEWLRIEELPVGVPVLLNGPDWKHPDVGQLSENGAIHNFHDGAEYFPEPTHWKPFS